jgi:hypothetical protein
MTLPALESLLVHKLAHVKGPVVVKAHELGPCALATLRTGHAKAVCTCRDPRDCVVSDMCFMNHSFDAAVHRIGASLESLRIFQSIPNVLLVNYEQMRADPIRQIYLIANHLEIHIDESAAHSINTSTSLENSQHICDSLKHRPLSSVYQSKSTQHRIDPTTHLHENHINSGTVGRWKRELALDKALCLNDLLAPWLVKLGYETAESLRSLADALAAAQHHETAQTSANLQNPIFAMDYAESVSPHLRA